MPNNPDDDRNLTPVKSDQTPSPLALAYARPLPRRRRRWQRVREFLRPDSLREFGTTLALVVPLTVLIWVWAEREQTLGVPEKVRFVLGVQVPNPTKVASLAPGTPGTITVDVTGPRAGVESLRDAIARDQSKQKLVVDVADSYDAGGPYDLTLESLLNGNKIFRQYGVTVAGAEPNTVQVFVDRQVERELAVRTPADLSGVVESATSTPQAVRVRGPERAIRALESAGKLVAELDLTAYLSDLRASQPGSRVRLAQVPLRPLDAPGVAFDVQAVADVSLQRSQVEQGELKSVVVSVNKAAALESTVVARVTPLFLTGVKVQGPHDLLQRLARDEVDPKPYAVVTITREDVGKRGTRLPIFINLPEGVRVVEGSVPPVQFEVIESTASGDTGVIP